MRQNELGAAAQQTAADDADSLFARRPVAALLAVAAIGAAAFCYVTGENLPVGLLPQIARSFHSSLSRTGLLLTAYAVVVVLASAPLTHLIRRVPRRLVLSGLLGIFVLGTTGSAAAPSYGWLLAARALAALSQAVFWSVAAVTAAGLFRPEARGRAIAGVGTGSAMALVLGVPAGTWLGQQAGWRVSFLALAAVGVVCLATVAFLLPTSRPSESHAAAGSHPDTRRYLILVVTTMLTVAGFFTAFTYVNPFLHRVSGLAEHDVAPVLLIGGIAATAGIVAAGWLYGRHPRLLTVLPLVLLTASLVGLYVFGTAGFVVAIFIAIDSFALGALTIALQTGVLVVAPRSSDIASAWYSASFNVGIASGPIIGGLVLSGLGLRSTPLIAALLVGSALVVVVRGRLGTTSARPGSTPKASSLHSDTARRDSRAVKGDGL